ncbi:hypothetical protein AB0M28_39510 [Streptomyces sp. NPDC051940]|uniref:hypothetical protein n=1 Tax=Streptomyces sp. NPDC051940 TaxID=3155675 RepID=UPI00342B4C8B
MALAAGGALMLEGIAIAGVQLVMAEFLDGQNMSLAGLDTDLLANGIRGGGLLFGGVLFACGVAALRMGVRDAAPGRFLRAVLIGVAVVHGVLGAVVAALVGWDVFAVLMVILGLVVFSVLAYGRPGGAEPAKEPAEPDEPNGQPQGPPAPPAPAAF